MKKDDILQFFLLVFFVGVIISLTLVNQKIKNETAKIDLPEEFNEHTISMDNSKPTILLATYDTIQNKYIIEFTEEYIIDTLTK
jgi:hypothetical protein